MTKKHFVALADMIRRYNQASGESSRFDFDADHIKALADWCQSQNSQFNRARWIAYIAGTCGPNGGTR